MKSTGLKKNLCRVLALSVLVSSMGYYGDIEANAKSQISWSSIVSYFNNYRTPKKNSTKTTTAATTEAVTTEAATTETVTTEAITTEAVTTEAANTEKLTVAETEASTEIVTTETTTEASTEIVTAETTTEAEVVTETASDEIAAETSSEVNVIVATLPNVTKAAETTEAVTEAATEIDKEETTGVTEESATEVTTEETEDVTIPDTKAQEIRRNINYYLSDANEETEYLWNQQLSNGAFAFVNTDNGSVYVNAYFGEITAIALARHDKSDEAKDKLRNYLDWHFAHLNTAEEDYNGLAGTIYDYNMTVEDGIVVSETSKGSYDSTDSYAALFLSALNEYVNSYGDEEYILEHKDQIAEVVNVIYATTAANGYTYAKPDYKICYLMDNCEVYSGLVAAKNLYENIIKDDELTEKLTASVAYYQENFEEDWWKIDHYASTISSKKTENSTFSWESFYPCVTSQMFPILFDLTAPDNSHSVVIYEKINEAVDWQNFEYVTNGTTVFYWCNFAVYGAKMGKADDLNTYMENYLKIVANGRKYPLYSSECAEILEACDIMMEYYRNQLN